MIEENVVCISQLMVGKVEWIFVEGLLCKDLNEFVGCIENNWVVNFLVLFVLYFCLIGQMIDVKINYVYLYLLCGEFVIVSDDVSVVIY